MDGFRWDDFTNLRDMVMVKEGSVRARLAAESKAQATPSTPSKAKSKLDTSKKVTKPRLKTIPEVGDDGSDAGGSDDNSADEVGSYLYIY